MKAFVLAAGFGSRLRPLTDDTPKPLLKVKGRSLIEWNLLKLKDAGFEEIIINTHHLGEKIETELGDGKKYDLKIKYSRETKILGTGGAILNAADIYVRDFNLEVEVRFDMFSVLMNKNKSKICHIIDAFSGIDQAYY